MLSHVASFNVQPYFIKLLTIKFYAAIADDVDAMSIHQMEKKILSEEKFIMAMINSIAEKMHEGKARMN